MNFDEDIKQYIKAGFDWFGIDYTLSGNLDSDLLNLFTVQKKFVYPSLREVRISRELTRKIDNECNHHLEIRHLVNLFKNGKDVNPFQSRSLFKYEVPDLLVYHWNIYYFHLSTNSPEGSYFNDRTKQVLFVYLDEKQALFLDVDKHPPHDVFADKRFLEIIDKNWNGVLVEAKNVVGLSNNLNRSERFRIRKKEIYEGVFEVNGKYVYAPGSGSATSKHSAEVSDKLIAFNRWLNSNTKAINSNRQSIDEFFIRKHGLKGKIEYELIFTQDGPQIWDRLSNTCLIKYREEIRI